MFLKKRVKIEAFCRPLISSSVPHAIAFFHRENETARYQLSVPDNELLHVAGGVILFFMARLLQGASAKDQDRLHRATKSIRRAVVKAGGNSDKAQEWWKRVEDDARIIHGDEDPLETACKAVWNRLFQDRPYKEHGTLRSFIYFLQVEVNAAEKVKLV